MPDSSKRYLIIKLIMVIMLAAIVYRLFDLQVINGGRYLNAANERLVSNIVAKAPRGEILDRYGTPLVTNKVGYSVVMQDMGFGSEEKNDTIRTLVEIMMSTGCVYYNELPISDYPYEFIFQDENEDGYTSDERAEWFEDNKYLNKGITPDMNAAQVMEAYKDIYHIDRSLDEYLQKQIIAVRYGADVYGMTATVSYTIADDADVETVTRIKENQSRLSGVSIINSYVREYAQPGLASHILGRTGVISREEYEAHSNDGYGYNDIIGKQGIEKWAESYLRGRDGTIGSVTDIDDEVSSIATDPVPGNYVVLTLDAELQRVTEESLEKNIQNIRSGAIGGKGYDCNAGAAVAIDIRTGDVLSLASYPTYDLSRYYEDYQANLENPSSPFVNRAVSGLYSPGSTFKPLTAIAAMQTGNLRLDETIRDEGVYRFYDTYQPTCWIWNEYQLTHGPQNVTQAIENSCNYFFYEVGRRMGIDVLDEYAAKFGLGVLSGIELEEESAGHMASPEYKKSVEKSLTSQDWYGGDTLQAAIGQSYSLFTPVQLANYAATIANGGVRHKVNLITSIRSSVDGSVVKEFSPEVEGSVDMAPEAIDAVKNGMRRVVDEGSASSIFSDYAIQIGGKTGTAQVGGGSNNAIFIAYAPFDNPEIAVAVVLEHGVRGTNAGYIARDIFDAYFHLNAEPAPEETISAAGASQGLVR